MAIRTLIFLLVTCGTASADSSTSKEGGSSSVITPDLSARPHNLKLERQMSATADALFRAWTTNEIERWAAAKDTALIKPKVNMPFFFETYHNGQRHAHYGRFLRLVPNRLAEMTWLNAEGTRGAETVLTIELSPNKKGTLLRLTHKGLPDEEAIDGYRKAWNLGLDELEKTYSKR